MQRTPVALIEHRNGPNLNTVPYLIFLAGPIASDTQMNARPPRFVMPRLDP